MKFSVLLPLITCSFFSFSVAAVTRLVGSDPVEFEKQKYLVEVPENSVNVPLLRLTVKVNPPGEWTVALLPSTAHLSTASRVTRCTVKKNNKSQVKKADKLYR